MVACARGGVIGKDGRLPWHLPADLRHFKRLTLGHTVAMGRRTYDSIGRPLPGRRNVVLSRDPAFHPDGVEVVRTVEALERTLGLEGRSGESGSPTDGEVFIIGGEQLFRIFLPRADRLYITEIDLDVTGDTFFPAWDPSAFRLVEAREGVVDERNPYPHRFLVYERIARG
ncbi:dihydrofolate reductase [Alicyclobacillus sp.]|uniref:dihydrofolate reductase n=1 Tax=Alicyclobacillus sp. TaxID=61169 RepID=UPI0025C22B40|nr:dihydrofolate reductase [Alicyclobacillus sp.]